MPVPIDQASDDHLLEIDHLHHNHSRLAILQEDRHLHRRHLRHRHHHQNPKNSKNLDRRQVVLGDVVWYYRSPARLRCLETNFVEALAQC